MRRQELLLTGHSKHKIKATVPLEVSPQRNFFRSFSRLILVVEKLLGRGSVAAFVEEHEGAAEEDEEQHSGDDQQVGARVGAQRGLVDPAEQWVGH